MILLFEAMGRRRDLYQTSYIFSHHVISGFVFGPASLGAAARRTDMFVQV